MIEKLKLKNITLIGHSMGAIVALLLIKKYPHDIRAFINVEGTFSLTPDSRIRATTHLSSKKFCLTVLPGLIKDKQLSKNKGQRMYAKTLSVMNPQAFYDNGKSLVFYADHGQILKKFLQLKIPKIYFYGALRKKYFLSTLKKLGRADCPVQTIAKSDHFPGHDNPRALYQAIKQFLKFYNYSTEK